MKFIKNNLIVKILLGLIFIYFVYVVVADPPGYCAAQNRYISDEEFIQIALRETKTSMNIDGSEESIRNFHAKNPDCCTVNRRQTQYFARFLSTTVNSVEVYLQYEMSAAEIARYPASKYYDKWIIIDECGKRLRFYGTSKSNYDHNPTLKKNNHDL